MFDNFFFQEDPFIKRYEELDVDVASYVCDLLDKMRDYGEDYTPADTAFL